MKSEWISYFGLFDGHGGKATALYLKNNLHNMIMNNKLFLTDPVSAIKQAFKEAEDNILFT